MAARELYDTPLHSDAYLEGYWRLEDTSADTGGQTLTNANSVAFNAAKFNNGADGGSANSNKSLYVDHDFGLTNSAYTITFWFKGEATGMTSNYIVSMGSSTTNNNIYVFWSGSGSLTFNHQKSGVSNNSFNATETQDTTTWHMATITYDGSVMKGYYDGSYVNQVSVSGNGTAGGNNGFHILTYGNAGSGQNYKGIVDDVAVFSRALTATEISNLYNGTWATTYTRAASLSMMNAASRYATAAYHQVIHWVRTASVTMMNSASRFASAAFHLPVHFARTASVSMMNAASRFATATSRITVVWVRTAAVNMMNAASRFASATKTLIIKISNKIRWDFFTWD